MCKRTLRDGTTKRTFRGCYSVTPVAWFRNQNPSFSTWFTFVTMLLGISSLKPLRRPPFSKQTNIRKKSFSFEIFSPSHEPPKMCHRKHFWQPCLIHLKSLGLDIFCVCLWAAWKIVLELGWLFRKNISRWKVGKGCLQYWLYGRDVFKSAGQFWTKPVILHWIFATFY